MIVEGGLDGGRRDAREHTRGCVSVGVRGWYMV